MKAYELVPREGLKMVERPSPEVGPYDARVRVRAVSLNYRDVTMLEGTYPVPPTKPIIPTSDGAGEVVAVGPKVRLIAVGDRVAANFFPYWLDGQLTEERMAALGGELDGMLAEEVALPETAWVKLPPSLSFEQAATLPCAGVTAWNSLFEAANVGPGDTILTQGTGGVATFALQLARATGANAVVTSGSAEKRAHVEKMGAMATIDYRATPKWGAAVREATRGRGVDVDVETAGATLNESMIALRHGGTLSLVGFLAGTDAPVDTARILYRNIRVHGVYVGSVRMFEDFLRAIETNAIEPLIDKVFSFAEAKAAYHYLASPKHFGKVVVRVD
jgi:NADPH:quinone reductase-like Zn-dependent oxidoreductase